MHSSSALKLPEAFDRVGIDVFQLLLEREGTHNVCVSPLCLGTALAIGVCGATGEVLHTMRACLLHDRVGRGSDVNKLCQKMLRTLHEPHEGIQFAIANGLWFNLEQIADRTYKEEMIEFFDAEMFQLSSSAEDINEWCARKTNGHINGLVDSLPSDAVLVLLSTIYFKGSWLHTFSKDQTVNADFKISSEHVVPVEMMFQSRKDFMYMEEQGKFQFIQLPYGTLGRFCASIILPDAGLPLEEFIQSHFSYPNWIAWGTCLNEREGSLFLPHIAVEYAPHSLKSVLMREGLAPAFENGDGFQRIDKNIRLEEVFHKTVLLVDEQGTQATAATAMLYAKGAVTQHSPFEMRVDRPFLFVLSDVFEGSIIFLGAIYHPTNSK